MDSKDKLITELHTQLIEKEQIINELNNQNRTLGEELSITKDKISKVRFYCENEIGNIIKYFDYIDTKDLHNILEILGDKENE